MLPRVMYSTYLGLIRSRKSTNDRQYNNRQRKKKTKEKEDTDKKNDQQNIIKKPKDRTIRTTYI